jgi:type II secretory pathway component PulC|tara:strand:+ start:2410 stop:2802 length:393 start_codon:yes stop_codon:yes gene_type:complete
MNTKQIKRLIIGFVGFLSIALFLMLVLNFINKPNIQDIQFTNIDKINKGSNNSAGQEVEDIKNADFSYTIVGYRYGDSRSSVIVKRGNKEFVLYEGDLLENRYELISISPDEIIFKGSGKLYKLENKIGK